MLLHEGRGEGSEGEAKGGFDLTCVAGSYEIVRVELYRAHVWFPIERPRYGVRLRYVGKLCSDLCTISTLGKRLVDFAC